MSSEIQFGELEQTEPERALRPDQDAHFATVMVGDVGDEELLIFVDLDVQRDMEAHALSNTRVELGGVMLGRQLVDEQGRPFVVVSDSLRAEHYEATKGSFKFTHETWSQISRQREDFRPDLEMVGWYHTHPGWSVFLSGMDLFICNNFFNRPLDVALVIDPCQQDRGWFQWTEDESPTTRRTGGFVLTTNRFRQLELDQFARIFNNEPPMNIDPRYSGNALNGSQPAVTIMENRKPVFEFAVIGMLMMQFFLIAFFFWQSIQTAEVPQDEGESVKIAELESRLEQLTTEQGRSMREDAYRDVLTKLVASQTGDSDLVDEFAQLKIQQTQMQSNLEGQLALSNQLKFERNSAAAQLDAKGKLAEKLEIRLEAKQKLVDEARGKYMELRSRIKEATGKDGELLLVEPPVGTLSMPWWWLAVGSIVVALMSIALGFAFGRRDDSYGRFEPKTNHPPQNELPEQPGENFDTSTGDSTPRPEDEVQLTIDGKPDDA